MEMSPDEQVYFGKYHASKRELTGEKVAVLHRQDNNPIIIIVVIINATAWVSGYAVVDFDRRNEALSWLEGALK